MRIQWFDHSPEALSLLRRNASRAAEAMGAEAVRAVREQMERGYGAPIRDTGALMADVCAQKCGDAAVDVGSTLPYAVPVHQGTSRLPARPFLRDALLSAAARLRQAAAQALRAGF